MTLPGFEHIEGLSKRAVAAIPSFIVGMKLRSKTRPVTSKEIETKMNLTGPEVRAIVSHLRTKGAPIASGGKGYFWAKTYNELGITAEHLKARIVRMQTVLNGLERPMFDYPNENENTSSQENLL